MYICKFSQNPSTGSEDNVRKRSYAGADANADANVARIRTKNNMPPPYIIQAKVQTRICFMDCFH